MNKSKIKSILDNILNLPTVIYILFGFTVSYLIFFVRPVFFNSAHIMRFFQYVPALNPIGIDLKQMLSYSESWAILGNTPYIGNNLYPPLASVLFTPLLLLDFFTAYKLVTLITLLSFTMCTLLIPFWVSKERELSSLVVFLFVTGVSSYGIQFELERGQFNVIAFLFSLLAVYIYHHRFKYRYVAYLLFSIAIQLKVYPAIFIVMFVRDWREWKNNIKRFLVIITGNFCCLFVLGPSVFDDFLYAIKLQIVSPYIWIGNHSIKSFVAILSTTAIEKLQLDSLAWVEQYAWLVEVMFLIFVGLCFVLIIIRAYQQNTGNLNSSLFLACTIVALLIPSVSHDYKLSILPPAIAIFLHGYSINTGSQREQLLSVLLLLIISIAYSSTLFSYEHKPIYLKNNLPALLAILLAVTILSLIEKPKLKSKI